MKRHSTLIALFVGLLAVLLAAAFIGCGEEDTKTTAQTQIKCDPNSATIIPAPSGRPQLVEFFRDT